MARTFSRTPPTEGWWKCCQDQREINPEIWGSTCPDCKHEICDDCTDIPAQARPMQRSSGRRVRCENTQHAQHAGNPTNRSRTNKRGWWICCQDWREVNPTLWGECCPDCSHLKCVYCTTL
ncbi:hypothetical protein NA56DRAFT_584295 [Hyaloscypha hepaticicola]|uniref:Uncharacterized protein n=1 Tax=Hyaloscypha hepaticicola TaxID=2082293 RepID=A0A2J6PJD3_9HELO|nr:hypothetical protein NA56DRAFT_584295 [Hyaloscypha hepaticicola]